MFLLLQKTTSASDATISVEDVSTFNKRTDMHVVRILMQPLPSFRLCCPMRLARALLLVGRLESLCEWGHSRLIFLSCL